MAITDKSQGEENQESRDLGFSTKGEITEMETVGGKHGGEVKAVSRGDRKHLFFFSHVYQQTDATKLTEY